MSRDSRTQAVSPAVTHIPKAIVLRRNNPGLRTTFVIDWLTAEASRQVAAD